MDNLLVNYLRLTSVLEISGANSGHPGICLGSAPIMYSIYKNANILGSDPKFFNRDRIVLSAGHGSALYYACLNLFGYDVTVDDLKNFRRLLSKTAGHPETNLIDGVDASTGPLGQGIGMAVGMAIAEEYLRHQFKVENFSPVDHYTYCLAGDGCFMEGVAQEAISLAGSLKLNKLIVLYDKNDITIEGSTSITNEDDIASKFKSCNWNTIKVRNGNSVRQIDCAIRRAKKSKKPTLIVVKTAIGFGSDLEGKNTVHGKPLSAKQIEVLRENLEYDTTDYEIPSKAFRYLQKLLDKKKKKYNLFCQQLDKYKAEQKMLYRKLLSFQNPSKIDFSKYLAKEDGSSIDFRQEGHNLFSLLYKIMPNLIGGCADLAPSTRANFDNDGYFCKEDRGARNIAFGIREHAMGAISNGISLHGGLKPFCSTFFTFANYMTPAIRLSAMMHQKVFYYFTHDSIAVGEDGPTHQPIEQIATLRAMPNLNVFRPCGKAELFACMQNFVDGTEPCAMLIPRQKLDVVNDDFEKAKKGGYTIYQPEKFDLTIIASGSEVSLALKTAKLLQEKGILAKIVSMPCCEIFDKQNYQYKNSVVDKSKPVFCIEASSDNVWFKYATSSANVFGLNQFGVSGNMEDVYKYFHFTPKDFAKFVAEKYKLIKQKS